jgi:hypothetical protein
VTLASGQRSQLIDIRLEPLAAAGETPATSDAAWVKQVAAMWPAQQVQAVVAKLKDLNPGFDGKATPTIEGGVVTGLDFVSDEVTDISPVRALTGLRRFGCGGSELWGKGKLADLSPLKDLKLTYLDCHGTPVPDLSPLKGMPLTFLHCDHTPVSDLSPLKGMPLTTLFCWYTPVTDAGLMPLQGMSHLRLLDIVGSKITDAGLAHLKDLTELEKLNLSKTEVTDMGLVQLKGLLDLRELYLEETRVTDAGLEHLAGLKNLVQLNLGGTAVTDQGVAKLKAALPNCNINR